MPSSPLHVPMWLRCFVFVAGGHGLAPAQDRLAPVRDLVERHCCDCHGGDVQKGGLDLFARAGQDAVTWLDLLRRVRERVGAGEMPPPDAEPLPAAGRQGLLAFCAETLRSEVPRLPPDPGRVTIRRLSRAEWEYTVLDLFGVRSEVAAGFPADDLGYGFDNIGDALSFSTLHLEKFLAAAEDVAAQVCQIEDPGAPARRRSEAEQMDLLDGPGFDGNGEVAVLYTRSTIGTAVELPRDGVYVLRVRVGADQAGDEPAKMAVRLDGRMLDLVEVPYRELRDETWRLPLARGLRRLSLSFVNDYYDKDHPDPARRDRNLRLDWLEVEGPLDPRPAVPQQAWLRRAEAEAASSGEGVVALARGVLPRLFRREVAADELQRFAAAIATAAGGAPELPPARLLLQAALASPSFLFRIEPQEQEGEDGTAGVVPVPGPALAVRLSYFLWSSAPDDELQALGLDGRLRDAAVLDRQVRRMLADPRAERLATNFGAQWLELRALADRTPDPARFPGFDDALRRSLRRESELLLLAVLREGLDVRTLLDADFTHLDATLAAFYGVPGAFGAGFERVDLPAGLRERGGLLGHAAVHAITSNPTRTSPVKRGKWVLENLLGQAPPPPPPGNDSFEDEEAAASPRGLREQLAAHRSKAACASCHLRMDALGFALERYDAIGRYREHDEHGSINATGELPDGRRLDGLAGLKAALRADPAFPRALARKLFVYAVGRDLGLVDRLRLDLAVDTLLARGTPTLADLVQIVVRSDAFQWRAAGP